MTTIITKNSSTAGAAPTAGDLVQGELAVNVTDKALYTENASGTVVKLNTPSIVDNGNATAITIDSSENVGVGVTPFANTIGKSIDLVNGAGWFGYNNSSYLTTNAYFNSGWLYKANGYATLYNQASGQHIWQIAASGTAGNAISFTQAMTLDASGNLLVGTTGASPVNTGRVRATVPSGGNQDVYKAYQAASPYTCYWARVDSTSSFFAYWDYNGGPVGSINTNGSATAYNTTSDYRLKEDIAPMTGALTKITALKPVTYKWKTSGLDGEGFIAHELAEVCPQAVTGEKDAMNEDGSIKPQGIDTSFLVATLTAAIQEQQTQISDQLAIIESLTARITALEAA